MQTQKKVRLFKGAGLLLSTLPGALTALACFPIWFSSRESAYSLLSLLVLALCLLPFYRVIREALKSPSAWQMWLVILVLSVCGKSLCQGLFTVALVAFPFSVAGALCFRYARTLTKEEEGK